MKIRGVGDGFHRLALITRVYFVPSFFDLWDAAVLNYGPPLNITQLDHHGFSQQSTMATGA